MTKAFDCALRLLARREHGMRELINKVISKGYSSQDSKDAVMKCQELDLQSDKRFAETICHTRFQQAYGPVRIMQELQAKYIDKEIIAKALEQYQPQWEEQAFLIWQKKFEAVESREPALLSDLQKQLRFLLYRGFPVEIATKIVHKNTSFLS